MPCTRQASDGGLKCSNMIGLLMKNINRFFFAFAAVFAFSISAQAEEYLLEFKESCSTEGKELKFECKKSDGPKHYVYTEGGVWKVRNQNNQVMTVFRVLRNDDNILILDHETLYSGNQTVHIMKKNNQFYLIQVAYSDILENNESTTKQGIYIKTKD